MRFALIGDGTIAKYHRKAIEHVGGKLVVVCDPAKYPGGVHLTDGIPTVILPDMPKYALMEFQFNNYGPFYVVIASPSYLHREQIKFILENFPANTQIICEKPAFLPWEPPIDDDRINICLQLQYAKDLPQKADKVVIKAVRDEAYFQSWKGDPKKTGGIFYNIFIHYIYMAHKLGADFEGRIVTSGKQERLIFGDYIPVDHGFGNLKPDDPAVLEAKSKHESFNCPLGTYRYIPEYGEYVILGAEMATGRPDLKVEETLAVQKAEYKTICDLSKIDMQSCYNAMYEDIISGGGIKPRDLFYLDWILRRNSEIFGYGKDCIGKTIKIGHELL